MKHYRIFFWVLGLACSVEGWAQKAQAVQGFARQRQSTEWYREQVQAWKRQTELEPKSPRAWYNYYRASRNLSLSDTTDRRSRPEKFEALSALVDQMEKKVPNSYEYHLIRWLNGGNNWTYLDHLQKADALGPDRTEHLEDLMVWKEMEGKRSERDAASLRWFASGQTSPGLLNYNYNVLAGLPENALLITVGDNDTFPLWILQARGFRTDVWVLNLSLLYKDKYRQALFSQLGLPDLPAMTPEPPANGLSREENFERKLAGHLAGNAKNRPVCLGLTCASQENLSRDIEQNLYLCGLHNEYSREPVDNLARLRKNFETLFALDYLRTEFTTDVSKSWVQHMNRNYLVPVLKLHHHYQSSGDCRNALRMKQVAEAVAQGHPEEAAVKETLRQTPACP